MKEKRLEDERFSSLISTGVLVREEFGVEKKGEGMEEESGGSC